jgi:hypothetical protein
MTAHALSFPEVLEEEYRYFFDDDPFVPVTFEREHVREITDLARFLRTLHDAAKPSPHHIRWHLLAERCFGPLAPQQPPPPTDEEAILAGLNRMLADSALLDQLLKDADFRDEIVNRAELRRLLLRVPKARRLLLERPELIDEMGDDDVINEFASRSTVIRVLDGEGFRQCFKVYPALLSTIADDDALSQALIDGKDAEALRRSLAALYGDSAAWRARLRRWFGNTVRGVMPSVANKLDLDLPADLAAMAQNAAELHLFIDKNAERTGETQTIEPKLLSRFNAIVIETAYGSKVSNGQTVRALYSAIHRQETAALCLSGGGIRSATFNLGILQGLADHRMLNRFHYLSTVSGGGYIGSWFSSWIRRHQEGAVGVAKDLARKAVDPLGPEVKPIVHLREYSSYLAPHSSAFSLDSWTLAATYLRNLLLNWMMLLPFLAALLAAPRLLEAYIRKGLMATSTYTGVASAILGVVALMIIGWVRPHSDTSELASAPKRGTRGALGVWFWLSALVASGITFCMHWASVNMTFAHPWWVAMTFAGAMVLGTAVHTARRAWIHAETDMIAGSAWLKTTKALFAVGIYVWRGSTLAALAGAAGGWLLYALFVYVFPPGSLHDEVLMELYVCFGVPLFLFVFFVAATLLIGFTTGWTKDYDREWWARAAAAVFFYCVMHVLAATAVLLLPPLIAIVAPLGGASGIAAHFLSRQLKKTARPADADSKRWLLPLLRLAAAVAMLFIAAAISTATTYAFSAFHEKARTFDRFSGLAEFRPLPSQDPLPARVFGVSVPKPAREHFQTLRETRLATLWVFVALATLLAFVMSQRLNVNFYSMHGMYRNRLIRAYLGASRWFRRPDPFTGFDPQDNIDMWELRPEALWSSGFVDFTAFAEALRGQRTVWDKLSKNARGRVDAYLDASSAPHAAKLRDVACAVVVDELNTLMLEVDLEHDATVAAPSPELLTANRKYLDRLFPGALKPHRESVTLAPVAADACEAVLADVPDGFRNPDAKPVLDRPPLHVLNVALNLVHGHNLAWQERKASSFTISPLHCGSRLLGYRDSAEYADRISLGTAMAISGAAVSPNMGALSSPTFTFLMTLFNARLGWWLGNPKGNDYREISPRGSITALLREALGMTEESGPFVFLSDGGHFDNLGLYEMVMRRCKYIVVCDASADEGYAFADLAGAVRKIRIDLGVPIEPLMTKFIGPQKDEKYGRYCALGEIRYNNVDGGDHIGYLLYIKPAIYSDCPPDVRNYRNQSAAFPHESTADQFFNETQFESYRALGRHIIGKICADQPGQPGPRIVPNVATFFGLAATYASGKQPPRGDAPVSTVNDIVSWMSESLA